MPPKLKAILATSVVAGLATLVATVAITPDLNLGSLGELVAVSLVLALTWTFPLKVLRRDETVAYQLDEAFLVAMALLMPPLAVVVAFGLAAVSSQLVLRRPLSRVLFNSGVTVTAAGTAIGVIHLLGGRHTTHPADLAAVVAGAAVFMAVNSAFLAAVMSVVEEQPFRRAWIDGSRFWVLLWASTVAVGLLAALAGSAHRWALLLALVPIGALHVVLGGSLQARADRKRLDGLLRAAGAAHASVESADVEDAVLDQARTLLTCREARLGEVPPGVGELGARLPGGGYPERWLVVSERRGFEPFGANDAKVLEGLAALTASALSNAGLVDQLKHEVFHDSLTGLPNQLLFEETVSLALTERRQSDRKLAVIVLDLDRFKRVNDSLGHPAGNELLRQVARRLTEATRAGDTVARMSGDEFILLVTGLRSTGEAAFVAEKVMAAFRTPFQIAGQELYVTASLGIALSPDDGTRPSVLLKNADTAMYRAKERGRNCFEIYRVEMNAAAEARLALEGDLHQAIQNGELRVAYQPQVDLVTGRITGVEALVRWDHPTLGSIRPDSFIPLAEESGLIVELDDWVLRTACAQVRAWTEAGLPPIRMAVNLSGRGFWQSRIAGRVGEVLTASGIDPRRLELEVTESMAVGTVDISPPFRELEALGVRLAIDDFGTGYSALGRLQGLPFHTLKIDRSFVATVENSHDEAPIVAAMIAMAHALGLEVVAEGVETEAQQSFLSRHGCDMAQGYLFSRPVDAAEVEKLLRPEPLLVA